MMYEIEKREDHILITAQEESLGQEEIASLENILEDISGESIILQLLSVRNILQPSKLEKLHNSWRKLDRSFIIIVNESLLDELSEELTLATTETEAFDILELEEIERQLLNN